ncbi:hypothetical protein [Nesterenkonia pannonica]|uniref:hypothetical protein n=1 Tax=Nesterenkonia pannonica TaxID=1548602 RepID=UPI002164B9DA|nr:hypothetical protein [Nesterenkonia pannonica]
MGRLRGAVLRPGETWALYTSFLQGASERASWLVSVAQESAGLVIFGPFLAGLLLWPVLRHGGVPIGSGLVLTVVMGSYILGVISWRTPDRRSWSP